VDVGSNSVLLTVAEGSESGWKTLRETSAVTALGEGLKVDGILRNAGKTLEALREAFAIADSFGAETRAYGTMALRIAADQHVFLQLAKMQDTPVKVISGETEAELGIECVRTDPVFAANKAVAVVDVGGHSTEIGLTDLSFRKSFPVGTLGLLSKYLADESPDRGSILLASSALDDGFAEIAPAPGPVVGLGASVTNLASIRAGLREWDPDAVHGSILDYEEISRFVGRTMRMTEAERAAIVGIEKGRERTIHIGALIVERALLALKSESIFVSVRGWRHAMLDRWL
jgi:exopolyphosphatase/guanosine-5'-triphosphate,3'-diphosphate pyrophosphatase